PKITVYYHLTGCSSIGGQLCDYHFIGKNMTWKAAKEYCRKHHTDLATVSNQTDMQRLHNHAKFQAGAWIGLQREWRWSQPGVEFNESKWSQGEPNNTCAMTTSNGKWSSDDCNNKKPFFCYNGEFIRREQDLGERVIYCRDHYRDLVSITNQGEQLWVQERAKMASTPYVWLGLRYTCTLDLWFWVTDEMVCYNNWGPGQPGDDCTTAGAMDREGTWVKKDDDNKFNFICSK
uniref:C-type lectin domain-containing protein n=1 Tax=Sander lucioperca TaxID=283035 RepID=A0A8D0D990_SANLU